MADKKISALTAATTPLAGTEVLPIVQSGSTVKVANNDLRPKQIQSNATSGVLQIAGPAAAATRVMTVPDANFTAARTDAANSFTGDQTLSTGNLVIGTSGKGIDFSADSHAAGMTSELLDDYEEGTWTPQVYYQNATDQSTATDTAQYGWYTKIGRQVTITFQLTFSQATATGSLANDNIGVKNFPFAGQSGTGTSRIGGAVVSNMVTPTDANLYMEGGVTNCILITPTETANLSNEVGTGSHTIYGTLTYFTA